MKRSLFGPCPLCGGVLKPNVLTAREMMLGLGDTFRYGVCEMCGSLRLLDPPESWARYYPSERYYSFASTGTWGRRRRQLRRVLRVALRFNRLPRWMYPLDGRLAHYRWLRSHPVHPEEAILDVGCGSGWLLSRFEQSGFSDLSGVDPYLDRTQVLDNGVRLVKGEIFDIDRQFGLIMFNHSLEHVHDPAHALSHAARHLAPGGAILLRVPVADSWAFRKYGAFWVQLDAPRHVTLMTEVGVAQIARRAGLEVVETWRDSTAFQIWGSEQYEAGLPLFPIDQEPTPRSPLGMRRDLLPRARQRQLHRQARALNRRGDGDQACFVLQASRDRAPLHAVVPPET